jgi:hypothetical protein
VVSGQKNPPRTIFDDNLRNEVIGEASGRHDKASGISGQNIKLKEGNPLWMKTKSQLNQRKC